jgi:hypothetical protein
MTTLVIPKDAWVPTTPELTSTPGARSPGTLLQVARQFSVETHARYIPRTVPGMGFTTFCNIYLWDVTSAMGAPIPHWINPVTGLEAPVGKGRETSANGAIDWLSLYGPAHGWAPSNLKTGIEYAMAGKLAVPVWKNFKGPGHVAVMLPIVPGPCIAQAGGSNFFGRPLASGFGRLPVSLYVHD